jgi:hypothetical protein
MKFTVKRPTRQAFSTMALVCFTILPTLYVTITVWRVNRPWHVREVESELSRVLGMKVSLAGVRHPRPGEDVLSGVVVRQEEPRGKQLLEIGRAGVVRMVRGDHGLVLEADQVHLRAETPRQAMAQCAALFQKADAPTYPRVSFAANSAELDLGPGGVAGPLKYEFRDVAGTFEAHPGAPLVIVSFHPTDEGSSTRCEATLTRDHRGQKVRTTLTFKTMEGLPLPARVLDPFFDTADWLGSAARVEGTLTLTQQGQSDWEAEFEGIFTDVDLSTLVSRRFPDQRLSGIGVVKVAKARWADRHGAQGFGWVSAEGEIRAGQGSIGAPLLGALKDEMQFRLAAGVDRRHGDLPYQNLGMSFSLGADGEIRIGGALGTEYPPGAVLVDGEHFGSLATAPEGTANVRGLIRTLFPLNTTNATALVPDTPESRILRFLPAPVTTAKRNRLTGN